MDTHEIPINRALLKGYYIALPIPLGCPPLSPCRAVRLYATEVLAQRLTLLHKRLGDLLCAVQLSTHEAALGLHVLEL